ncbi:MAG: hypothetical protein LBU34_15740 [Planctomycetaceae bacterium]|jgi:hypothetical protein|nr:hypothetical protein [Planctomycetaceae bacterium]
MATQKENLNNPGIFVRIFDDDDYEVRWLNGHEIIEVANGEELGGGERITAYLERKHVDSYVREMYSPWGEFEGVVVLRRLTLYEAVHYLGREARICAFLRPKMQAVRFIEGLQKGKDSTEHQVAEEIKRCLTYFDEDPEIQTSKAGFYRMMEEQLLNISIS